MTMKSKSNNAAKARQAIKVLLAKPEFRGEVAALQRKWGVEEGNPNREKNMRRLEFLHIVLPASKAGKRGMEMRDYPAFIRCRADLQELGAKFGLDYEYWLLVLWEYVRTGNVENELLNYNLPQADTVPKIKWDFKKIGDKRKKRVILIELGDDTTLNDLKAVWHQVEEMRRQFNMVKPKFKEWKNLERDSKVYALYQRGLTISEISTKLLKEDSVDLDYGNIKKIVSTYRKRIGLPKDRKLETSRIKVNRSMLR